MEEPASEGEWFANGTCEMEVMGSWNHGKRLSRSSAEVTGSARHGLLPKKAFGGRGCGER